MTDTLNATENWWGSDTGPSGDGPGTGDSVSANVDFDPWLNVLVGAGDPVTDEFAVTADPRDSPRERG
jgi:hypothetical protein